MVSIQGVTRKSGIAIATAAVVDMRHGIGGVLPALLNEGMRALKAELAMCEWPDAVVACDTLVMGLSARIPGVNTVGIAAESDEAVEAIEPEVPCVIGLPNLTKSISEGDILIVDGNSGVVYVDPDLGSLLRYQEIEDRAVSGSLVFIAAEHLPAKTPSGETVYVYAHVTDEAGLVTALDQGADGVLTNIDAYDEALQAAAGKPVWFVVEDAMELALRSAMLYSVPRQVTMLFRADVFDALVVETDYLMELATADALINDLNPPQVALGVWARDIELPQADFTREPASMLVDLRKSTQDPEQCVVRLIGAMQPERVMMLLGERIEAVARVVEAGARCVAVAPELVGAAKMAIRSMGEKE